MTNAGRVRSRWIRLGTGQTDTGNPGDPGLFSWTTRTLIPHVVAPNQTAMRHASTARLAVARASESRAELVFGLGTLFMVTRRRSARGRTAEGSADASQEARRIERLAHIVVGAFLRRLDLRVLERGTGEHDSGKCGRYH